MDINFELYKIFYHAAESGSFSAAAEKLFISQSAVSQAIKSLEEKMGVQLFLRNTRSIRLTSEGELLYSHVGQAFNFIKTAESKIFEMQTLQTGEIRIGVSDTVCKYFLIPYIEHFSRLHPKVKIRVINRTSSQISGILRNGLVDLGIVTLPVNDKSMKVEEFISVEDIFVASSKFPELSGKNIHLRELAKYPLLTLDKNSTTRRNLDDFLKQQKIHITTEIELESVDLLVEFARIGMGVAHVLKESALNAIQRGELAEVKTVEELPARKLGIITMENVPLSRASIEFIEMMKPGV